jgi:hypothetical protein
MRKKSLLTLIPLVLVLALATVNVQSKGKGGGKGGGKGKPVKTRITLTAVGSDTDATGFAQIFFRENSLADQKIQVKIEKAARNAIFTIVVDGNILDTITTNNGGTFEAIYEQNPKGSHRLLPASFTPVTNLDIIEFRDSSGQAVVRGSFKNTGPGPGTGVGCNRDKFESDGLLITTGTDPDAKGTFEIDIDRQSGTIQTQEFRIKVENLAPNTTYKIFANNTDIATFTTNGDGRAEIRFSSQPKGTELLIPPSFSPLTNITLIQIRDAAGTTTLLSGDPAAVLTTVKFESDVVLTGTSIDADARGTAEIDVRREAGALVQELIVKGTNLAPSSVFKIFAGGVEVATITTSSSGSFDITLRTQPSSGQQMLPAGVNLLNVTLIEVKNSTSQTVLATSTTPANCGKDDVEKEINFTNTGIDTNASGEAEIEVEKENGTIDEQKLKVKVENLDAATTFRIFVDNVEIATFTTSNDGKAEVVFSSKPKGSERTLPSAINPLTNVKVVDIRTMSGQILLTGTF